MKYLIDTCTWRDFYEDRTGKSGKPLGRHASDFFVKILKRKNKILFSEALIWELEREYSKKDISNMLNILFNNNILARVEITEKDYREAKKLSKERNLLFVDCLNAIQARNNKAIMISEDKHFTENLSDIVKTLKPSEVK